MTKNIQARKNFIEWYFTLETRALIIEDLMDELIEQGKSKWTFDDLVDSASDVPKHIEDELKYADRLDDEMRADAEVQDFDTFGKDKI